MKKFNKNSILFVFAAVFIAAGFGLGLIKGLGKTVLNTLSALRSGDFSQALTVNSQVDSVTQKRLSYHGGLMDINSIKDRLLGTRIALKDDGNIIRTDDGSLVVTQNAIDSQSLSNSAGKVAELKSAAEANGADFLFCIVPTKTGFEKLPENVSDCSNQNCAAFVSELERSAIPVLDFGSIIERSDKGAGNCYYKTDHHWTARMGFDAAGVICRELEKLYGFEFNREYTDMENYNTKTYSDWFLGSYGKKVGTYFTPEGADDFELITPKFDTDMTEEQPFKESVRNGKFEETVLYLDNLKKNYYDINAYATYSGGDFRLQIMRNNLNPNGKKILLIRDSMACVVAPFLALQTSELHACDVRDYEYLVGEKLNMEDYIKQIAPDYVLVLFEGSGFDGSRYDFF
ncbi:MAG: hypothetical protein IKI64_05475 [Clostridia bacterium]|nr:hypothetical protein [Clostridia bacterium]